MLPIRIPFIQIFVGHIFYRNLITVVLLGIKANYYSLSIKMIQVYFALFGLSSAKSRDVSESHVLKMGRDRIAASKLSPKEERKNFVPSSGTLYPLVSDMSKMCLKEASRTFHKTKSPHSLELKLECLKPPYIWRRFRSKKVVYYRHRLKEPF